MAVLVDAHVHVVSPDRQRYPLDPGVATNPWYETHPCSGPELRALMAGAGVDAAVLVQGVGAYRYDNRYALDVAAAAPEVFSTVVCTDRTTPDAAATVAALVAERNARGYRWFTVHDDDRLAEPRALWDALAALGVPVVVTILAHQLPTLAEIARAYPAVPIALDHCGFVDFAHGVPDELRVVRAHPNLFLKVSTHALHAAAAGGDPADAVAELAARFDGRIMWGSDWSQTHHAPYAEIVAEGRAAAAKLSAAHRHAYLAGSAIALWPELA